MFLAKKSRMRKVSREYFEPTILNPINSDSSSKFPAGEKCLQNTVTEFGNFFEDFFKIRGRNFVNLAVATGDRADWRRISRQHCHIARKLFFFVNRHALLLAARFLNDFNAALFDDKEFKVTVSNGKKRLAILKRLDRWQTRRGRQAVRHPVWEKQSALNFVSCWIQFTIELN